ncbi:uncharacterized protein LOC112588748 isoform X2 [Harpegnathos saltator]|uniref:uncharacterized protein LOC112588748 isoform X2 n=1 Tax=Harpegnathos saltator TaxID=610380 RepID=UPI000DBEEA5F|nr:uncharacterized protein LOC112588748 isoform X2 [Harpegnathos saltator]
MNGSRSCCTLPIVTEYFIDQEKYFYIIILHMDVAFCIGAIAMIGTGTWLVVSLKHACSIFKIASYRIELAIANNCFINNDLEDKITIYERITYAVDIHCKAMQLVMSSGNDMEEMILRLLTGMIIIIYMFLANYAGQEITDHNDYIYLTAYNVCWYIAPLHVQKLILFLLQRGSKTFSLTVGGLFAASLECFASLASASVSYFTVMYSTQQ